MRINKSLSLSLLLVMIFLFVSLALWFLGCKEERYGGALSQPAEAHVDILDNTLNRFDVGSLNALFRYLASNSRWEVREDNGIKFAIRREKVLGDYKTTMNGVYLTHAGIFEQQTRVVLSFGQHYRVDQNQGNITHVKAGTKNVAVTIEGPHLSNRDNSSYVVIEGAGLFLEIFEQSNDVARIFTKRAFSEVCSELADVLKYKDEINTTGLLPITSHYREKLPKKGHFKVNDGMQKGIYLLNAAVNPSMPGYIYIKVFDASAGKRLSAEQITRRSIRYVGWSKDGANYFPYNSEITIYEGDWSNQYMARFEVWHRSQSGVETKLAETSRLVNGWQR